MGGTQSAGIVPTSIAPTVATSGTRGQGTLIVRQLPRRRDDPPSIIRFRIIDMLRERDPEMLIPEVLYGNPEDEDVYKEMIRDFRRFVVRTKIERAFPDQGDIDKVVDVYCGKLVASLSDPILFDYFSQGWGKMCDVAERVLMERPDWCVEANRDDEAMDRMTVSIVFHDHKGLLRYPRAAEESVVFPLINVIEDLDEAAIREEGYRMALLVGPWLMEWDETELCLPRRLIGRFDDLVKLDVKTIVGETKVTRALAKLSKAIAFWNTRMLYNDAPKTAEQRSYMDNGAAFVNDLLLELGEITMGGGDPVKLMLSHFVDNAKTPAVYVPSEALHSEIDDLGLPRMDGKIVFQSHEQLDKFYRDLLKDTGIRKSENFRIKFPHDHKALSLIDRLFWRKFVRKDSTRERAVQARIGGSSRAVLRICRPLGWRNRRCKCGCKFVSE